MLIKPQFGTRVSVLDSKLEEFYETWTSQRDRMPVPVIIERAPWEQLLQALSIQANFAPPLVAYRLLMKRYSPRRVLEISRIESTILGPEGVGRWKEGGYPQSDNSLRKGGNAFFKDHVKLAYSDAWWMGREQTQLRLLFAKRSKSILLSAWWARENKQGKLGSDGTDGDLWPVHLIVDRGRPPKR